MTNFSRNQTPELRAYLAAHHLDTSGNKPELVARSTVHELGLSAAKDAGDLISRYMELDKLKVSELNSLLIQKDLKPEGYKKDIIRQILLTERQAPVQQTSELLDLANLPASTLPSSTSEATAPNLMDGTSLPPLPSNQLNTRLLASTSHAISGAQSSSKNDVDTADLASSSRGSTGDDNSSPASSETSTTSIDTETTRDPSVYRNRLNRLREMEQLASPQRTAAYNMYRQNNKRLARADREVEESGGIPPEQRTIAPAIAEATRVTLPAPTPDAGPHISLLRRNEEVALNRYKSAGGKVQLKVQELFEAMKEKEQCKKAYFESITQAEETLG